ncbi:hypothetical protein D9M68_781510 [compost metagenome]
MQADGADGETLRLVGGRHRLGRCCLAGQLPQLIEAPALFVEDALLPLTDQFAVAGRYVGTHPFSRASREQDEGDEIAVQGAHAGQFLCHGRYDGRRQ